MECCKIPDIICLEDYNGNYQKYEEAVYALYQKTLGSCTFYFEGKEIHHKVHPLYKDKSATFWHIISSGTEETNRTPDLRRYETIAWPGFILDYCMRKCKDILIWKNVRKKKCRTLLWCRDIDYVVILDEREDFYIFWTAYPVKYKHTREKMLNEYYEYHKKPKDA